MLVAGKYWIMTTQENRLEIYHVLVQFQPSKEHNFQPQDHISSQKLSNFSRAKNHLGHVTVVNILQVLPLTG